MTSEIGKITSWDDEIEKYKFWLTKRSDEPRDQRPENSTGIIE